MNNFSEFICKYRKIILIITIVLSVFAFIGMNLTRINYDILVYLPEDIETVQGENILSNEFNMGSFATVILDNMNTKEIIKLENDFKKLDNVVMAISTADVIGEGIPVEMLPDEIQEKVYKDGSTIMLVTFHEGISDDETLQTVIKMREIADKRVGIGGMSAVVVDTKDLSDQEVLIYVIIAVALCLLILQVALDSYFAPFLMLLNIGIAILYNLGTNIFLGEISYITKAISAVLQLGVTMDFAIFLYHSFMQEKKSQSDNNKAMATAISKTMVSVVGSSLTTIAGFLALCSMNLTLGKDIGIVMAKGVLFGVICVVTILPAMILECNKLIEKTRHKEIMPKFRHLKEFSMKYYVLILVVFIIILPIAYFAQKNTDVYYKLDSSLPRDLPSITANSNLRDKFNMVSTEIILVDKNLEDSKVNEMLDEIENLDGVEWALGLSRVTKYGIPKEILPNEILEKLESDNYQLVILNSSYEIATDELNEQVNVINGIIKKYDKKAILVGEGPLMKDLAEISDHDFNSVNTVSIAVIFVLMLLVLKSISLPVILIFTIEFAIFINMGIPYFTKTELPFVASIVIGTIQLGATIDYAILITTKYIDNRKSGLEKKLAIEQALGTSISSIFTSGLCFFGATFGVGVYSKLEMIGSLCTLMSRGAIISMFTVVLVLPAFLLIFDKIICKTTVGMTKIKN